jgi:hypothetical protein
LDPIEVAQQFLLQQAGAALQAQAGFVLLPTGMAASAAGHTLGQQITSQQLPQQLSLQRQLLLQQQQPVLPQQVVQQHQALRQRRDALQQRPALQQKALQQQQQQLQALQNQSVQQQCRLTFSRI